MTTRIAAPLPRPRSLLAVGAIALGALVLSSGPALAAPGDAGTGTITVHKLEQGSSSLGPADGSQLDIGSATPVEAGFTACVITEFDLSDPAAWDRLSNVTVTLTPGGEPVATEGGTPLTLECGTEQTTALPSGTTVFDLDADQAFVIYESTPAANAVAGAQPTVITLPYPGNGAEGSPAWNYDPHLYPKNVLVGSGATKDGSVVGDQVSFDVTVPIQPLAPGETYTEFRINDQLGDFLQYSGATVTLAGSDGVDIPLTAGTDYTVSAPSGSGGDEVVLTLLTPGLALLDSAVGGTLVLTINADAIGTGSTANEAQITINGKGTEPGTGPSVPDPEEFFTGAHILKEAQNKGAADTVPLAGALFDVYLVDAAATECPATPAPEATAVLTDQESNASGVTPDQILGEGNYCVYETTVPAGYKGLVGGMLFTVAGEDSVLTVVNTQIGSDPGDLPELPLTGAAGGLLLGLGGAAMIAIATVLLTVRHRRLSR